MNHHQSVVLVIASVLKPVDDVRMYKKIGKSLASRGKYAVHIVGYQPPKTPTDASVRFHPLFRFSRASGKRLLANYFFYRALRRIAPRVLVLTTPELYPAAWWYRWRTHAILAYDIVENYHLNLQYNRGFTKQLVDPLRTLVSFLERRAIRSASLLLSAEKGYLSEMSLASSQVHVIENKALVPQPAPRKSTSRPPSLTIVYTGTVSEVYGIRQALAIVQSLIEEHQLPATLTVLGHVPMPSLHAELQDYARHHPWLMLRTDDRPVPHDDILSLIRRADWGMVSHQPVPSIARCFPTRIWEYMAYRVPFFLQDHPYWTSYCAPWDCAIPIDFNRPATQELKQKMMNGTFYPRGVPDTIYWNCEEERLLDAFDAIRLPGSEPTRVDSPSPERR